MRILGVSGEMIQGAPNATAATGHHPAFERRILQWHWQARMNKNIHLFPSVVHTSSAIDILLLVDLLVFDISNILPLSWWIWEILVCLRDFGQIPGPSSVLFGGCCCGCCCCVFPALLFSAHLINCAQLILKLSV
jgi:hypothetical protein